jgi:hypothetical protein
LTSATNVITIIILRSHFVFKNGKNVSSFLIISLIIHPAEIRINKFVMIPKGFNKKESIIFPCNNSKVALVDPHEGQGRPVMFLKIQKE